MTNPGDLLTKEEKKQGIDAAVAGLDFDALDADDLDLDAGATAGGPELLIRAEKQAGIDAAVAGLDFDALDTAPVAPPVPPRIPAPRPRRATPPPPPPPPPPGLTPAQKQTRAKDEFIATWEQTQQVKNQIAEVKAKLKKYEGLGKLLKGLPRDEHIHRKLILELDELQGIKGKSGDLKIKKEELEQAKQKALDAGVAERELSAEVASRRNSATPFPTEGAGARGTESARKVWAKEIAKGILGAGAFVFGVDAVYVLPMYAIERIKVKTAKKEVQDIIDALKSMTEAQGGVDQADFENLEFQEKIDELTRKIGELQASGNLKSQDAQNLLTGIKQSIEQYRKATTDAKKELAQELGAIVGDHIQYKTTGKDAVRSLLNAAFVGTGYQLARGSALLGLAGLKRAAKARQEDELRIRAERLVPGGTLRTSTWNDKNKLVWNDIVNKARGEWWRSVKMQGATAERTGKMARGVDFVKAACLVLRFVGIGSAAVSEIMDSGVSPSHQIERILDEFEKHGAVGAVKENYLRNIEQVLHIDIWGLRVEAQAEATPAVAAGVATETAAATPPEADLSAIESFNNTHHVLAEQGFHTTLENGTKVVQVGLGNGNDFKDARHALLAIVGQEANVGALHGGQTVDSVDAGRWLNAVANLNDLRTGHITNIEGLTPEKVHEFLSYDKQTGQLTIKDYDRFSAEIMNPLLNHANANVNEHSGAIAWIRKLLHSRFDKIAQARVEDLETQGTHKTIAVEDFNHSAIVKSVEVQELSKTVHSISGLEHLDIQPNMVQDVNSATIPTGNGQVLHIVDGYLEKITTTIDGHPHMYDLDHAVDFDGINAGDQVSGALREAQVHAGGGEHIAEAAAPVATTGPIHEALAVHRPADLYHTASEGGLKGPDGMLHLGGLSVKEGWFTEWDDQSVKDFIKDAPARISPSRWFSAEADAHYRLAQAMESHKADMRTTVGQWTLENVKRLKEWVR